jgi:acetyltransferase-like isoleucine patch superfamily enzyme
MNRQHAFAIGLVYPYPSSIKNILIYFYRGLTGNFSASFDTVKAWRQFNKNAVVSQSVLLSPNAWCLNCKPTKNNILINDRVICRGIIRVESYGEGRLVIHPDVYIGDDSLISCVESIEIGSMTMISHGVQIFDNDSHPLNSKERELDYMIISKQKSGTRPKVNSSPIKIGSHVWLGFNSIITKGVTIGDRSIIAAGSVVTKDVPPNTLVAGNPARHIREVE